MVDHARAWPPAAPRAGPDRRPRRGSRRSRRRRATGRRPSRSSASPSSRRVAREPEARAARAGPAAPISLDRLRRVGDHDEALGRRGDDLLARVGAAAALDQPAVRGDLVGAVDRDVEPVEPVERLDRDARARAPAPRSRARWRRSGSSSSRAASAGSRWATVEPGAEPDHHPVLDQLGGRLGGGALLVLVRSRPASNASPAAVPPLVRLRSMAPTEQPFDELDQLRINTIRTLVDRRDPEGELGPPGDADGAGAGRLRALAALPALRPRATRSGRTATASCSRPATPRCCSTRCSTWPGCRRSTPTTRSLGEPVGHASTTSSASASSTRRPPATPSTAGPPASRRRPARSARASRPRSGWRSRRKWLAAHFNRPGFELFDFDVYAIAGDG